jgi:predicted Holliday junction resolvase-like endonuclease
MVTLLSIIVALLVGAFVLLAFYVQSFEKRMMERLAVEKRVIETRFQEALIEVQDLITRRATVMREELEKVSEEKMETAVNEVQNYIDAGLKQATREVRLFLIKAIGGAAIAHYFFGKLMFGGKGVAKPPSV